MYDFLLRQKVTFFVTFSFVILLPSGRRTFSDQVTTDPSLTLRMTTHSSNQPVILRNEGSALFAGLFDVIRFTSLDDLLITLLFVASI